MFKVIEDYFGMGIAVVHTETGEPAEIGYETLAEAKRAAKNFNEWN